MLFDGPLELKDGARVAWHPVLPARDLQAYRGRTVGVTEDYLRAAAQQTTEYYADLAAQGSDYRRPILVAHQDGLRLGDLIDFEVRDFKGDPTLFVKSEWLPEHWQRVHDGEYERGSIKIVPEHTDPQSGKTYGPFIEEFSVTEKPVIKDYRLTDVVEPAALAAVGLSLSEEAVMPQEQEQVDLSLQEEGEVPAEAGGGGSQLAALLTEVMAMLAQVSAEIAELMGIKGEMASEEDPAAEEVVASEDAAVKPPAEPSNVIALSETVAEMRDELARMKRAGKLNTAEKGAPGTLELGKMTAKTSLAKAKAEGLVGIAAVERAKELRGEK